MPKNTVTEEELEPIIKEVAENAALVDREKRQLLVEVTHFRELLEDLEERFNAHVDNTTKQYEDLRGHYNRVVEENRRLRRAKRPLHRIALDLVIDRLGGNNDSRPV